MIRPSRVINSISGEPYLRRWHVIPRNRWCNIYLHHFVRSDDDRALHDHPWWSVSFLLKGQLSEIYSVVLWMPTDREPNSPIPDTNYCNAWRYIRWMRPIYRPAAHAHRLVVPEGEEAWTLFITGPVRRAWGFHCPNGWKHQRPYHKDGGCND